MPRRTTPPPGVDTYGCPWLLDTQLAYDRWAFGWRMNNPGMPRRPKLFQQLAEEIYPKHFEWHDWTWKVVETLCDVPSQEEGKAVKLAAFPGCASAAKTYNIVGFAVVWWLCNPAESSVTLVSTTVKSLRRRGWAEVQKCYDGLGNDKPGNFVDSRMLWQAELGDDKNAVIGRAVEEGAIHKVADDIKGVHTRRQMVIIDEATSVPEAIYEACANLYSYPEEFLLVCIGNPRNRLDAFGRFCEPDAGWLSVSVDSEEWAARPFGACGGAKPTVVTFDAEKSPNILAERVVSRHLPTKESVDKARAASGGQTPHYWQNFRGFWAPDNLEKTVFTESALVTFEGSGKHRFSGDNFQIIGAFDPAYTSGGDRAALRFAKLGEIEGEKWGIELMPPIIIPINAASTNPAHYQLAEQVRRQCERVQVGEHRLVCPPQNLGVDDSGEGGLCDVLYRTWSQRIHRIEFGGSASAEPCSLEDVRPADEVYMNKRAEMWFRARDALNSGQLKGIDPETATELVSMEFSDKRAKLVLMPKKDYRAKFGKSCDLADTVAILLEVARLKGFALAPLGETAKALTAVGDTFKAQQEVYGEPSYSDEEPPEPVIQGESWVL